MKNWSSRVCDNRDVGVSCLRREGSVRDTWCCAFPLWTIVVNCGQWFLPQVQKG